MNRVFRARKNRCLTQLLHERTPALQVFETGTMNENGVTVIPLKKVGAEARPDRRQRLNVND